MHTSHMKRNATNHTRCRTGTPVPALTHAHAQQDGNRTAMRGALDTGKRELNRDCPTHSHTPHRTPRRHRIAREPHMWSLRQCRRSSHLAYGKAATAQRCLCVSPVFAPSIPARPTTAAGCASHAHCCPVSLSPNGQPRRAKTSLVRPPSLTANLT